MDDTFNKWLQSRLTAHGFAVGPIDGVIGPTTLKALKAFEAKNGLVVDGSADAEVVKRLRINALKASSSALSPEIAAHLPDRDTVEPPKVDPILQRQWPRQGDVPKFFGNVGENQTIIDVPFDLYLAWDKTVRTKRMSLHKKVADSALRALETIASTYSLKDRADLGLNLFGGSLNVRRMRNGKSYSMHSWGIAIDFDPERNALNTHQPAARLSHADAIPFWRAWENEGWLSLGRARDFDWMHVQAARL